MKPNNKRSSEMAMVGERENILNAFAFSYSKAQTFNVLPFKMQQCKGHGGGDETRSCNKEGEIKNNDRNKLS